MIHIILTRTITGMNKIDTMVEMVVIMATTLTVGMIDANMRGTHVGETEVIITITITTGFALLHHSNNIIIDVNRFPHHLILEILFLGLSAE